MLVSRGNTSSPGINGIIRKNLRPTPSSFDLIFNEIVFVINRISDMKYLLAFTALLVFASCRRQEGNTQPLQAQIDSLKHELENSYKPGFGEFMSSIQVHHDKLWFAGTNNNWELADFEIHEIEESLEDLQTFCADRAETNSLQMIDQPLKNVSDAIHHKNSTEFRDAYMTLTSNCNSCHRATQHAFNVIAVPTTPPFSNQRFEPAR